MGAFGLPNFRFRARIIAAAKMNAAAMVMRLSKFELLRTPITGLGVTFSGCEGVRMGEIDGVDSGLGLGVA